MVDRLVQGPRLEGGEGWLDDSSLQALRAWLAKTAFPLGIATSNMQMAWGVSRVLRRAGVRVPEDVGLIAIGEDPVLLEQARPHVSGVAEDGEAKGRICADYLDSLMRGKRVNPDTLVPPVGVVQRASTDHFAVEDPAVAKALTLIRDEVEDLEGVEDLARRCHVSRATLLRRFQACRGRTPGEEIRQARIRRAVELIEETNLPLAEVAVAAGFGLQSALSRAVKNATGKTPTALRMG